MDNGTGECETTPLGGDVKGNVEKSKPDDAVAVATTNGSPAEPDESSTPPVIDESRDAITEDTLDPLGEPPELEKVAEAGENGIGSPNEDPLKEDVEMNDAKPETLDEPAAAAAAAEEPQGKDDESGEGSKQDDRPDETSGQDEASQDGVAIEEQTSSTSSSPTALHIHLDEEDKDESLNGTTRASSAPAMELTVDSDKDAALDGPDPTLPLISSVVSLSSMANEAPADPAGRKPQQSPPPASVSPTPSTESNGQSTRRTTLRLKRGIEISFDVDKNGQPVSVNHQRSDSSAPSGSSSSSGEPREKRVRVDDEDDDDDLNQPDLSELDSDGTNTLLAAVQRDIRTLRFMAKQKEKEWNCILKLMKVKEELQAKLMRHREVMKITSASARKTILPSAAHLQQVVAQSQVHQPAAAASLQTLINQSLNVMMSSSGGSSKPAASVPTKSEAPLSGNHSGRQLAPHHQPHLSIHQQQQAQQQAQQQMQSLYQQQQQQQQQQQSKMNPRQRPILPKPSMQVQPDVQIWNHHASGSHHHHHHHHHATVVDSAVAGDPLNDPRSKQGTVSVQSLIADYRAKHPEEIPTRGRRVRQPSRISNDPNSSSSPPPGNLQQSIDPASGMSFKDVLLQFAKMSSRQGHANPGDLIQLGKESPGSSASGLLAGAANASANSSAAALQSLAAANSAAASSSAAALQSLAAARNARGSPHATNLSAGSILQSALSGTGRGTNPSFAPTLAQLLTNPANEQQQQQQQPLASLPPQQQALALTSSTPAASASSAGAQSSAAAVTASTAEVLTLSNLLATAKGGTSGVGSTSRSQAASAASVNSASANGSNYMRTSGGGEVPRCQGCNERVAQFVCAGCSSQWYCSRECQVAAWEEHSEHCVG